MGDGVVQIPAYIRARHAAIDRLTIPITVDLNGGRVYGSALIFSSDFRVGALRI